MNTNKQNTSKMYNDILALDAQIYNLEEQRKNILSGLKKDINIRIERCKSTIACTNFNNNPTNPNL